MALFFSLFSMLCGLILLNFILTQSHSTDGEQGDTADLELESSLHLYDDLFSKFNTIALKKPEVFPDLNMVVVGEKNSNIKVAMYLETSGNDTRDSSGLTKELNEIFLSRLIIATAGTCDLVPIRDLDFSQAKGTPAWISDHKKDFNQDEKIKIISLYHEGLNYAYNLENPPAQREEILMTTPLRKEKSKSILSGPFFTVGDSFLDYSYSLTIYRMPYENKLEVYSVSFLTLPILPFDDFFFEMGISFTPSKDNYDLEKSILSKISVAAVFLHCAEEMQSDCKKIISESFLTHQIVKTVFVVTDTFNNWGTSFLSNRKNIILLKANESRISESDFFKSFKKYDSIPVGWKIEYSKYMYPNPEISRAARTWLEIKPDILAIGGPFNYDAFMYPYENLVMKSTPEQANARFAGMLVNYLSIKNATESNLDGDERSETPVFDQIMRRAQNTATPFIYNSSKVPLHLRVKLFNHELDIHDGLVFPVHWQGAGLVNLDRMIRTKMEVAPSKLELGIVYTNMTTIEREMKLKNQGDYEVRYEYEVLEALGLDKDHYPIPSQSPMSLPNKAFDIKIDYRSKVKVDGNTIIVPARTSVQLNLTVTFACEGISSFVDFSGYIKFKRTYIEGSMEDDEADRLYGDLYVPFILRYVNSKDSGFRSSLGLTNDENIKHPDKNDLFLFKTTDVLVWTFLPPYSVTKTKVYLYDAITNEEMGLIGINDSIIDTKITVYFPNDVGRDVDFSDPKVSSVTYLKQAIDVGYYKFCIQSHMTGVEFMTYNSEKIEIPIVYCSQIFRIVYF